ncbi:hypothetical protein XFF6994_4410002 [Xanthomonas citri pv. fuscans]|nr:hypothetical protein XFF6994_4410002 [Xanthomonas citri pv. fuscans]
MAVQGCHPQWPGRVADHPGAGLVQAAGTASKRMFRHRGTRTPRRLRTAQVADALFVHGASAPTQANERQRPVRARLSFAPG